MDRLTRRACMLALAATAAAPLLTVPGAKIAQAQQGRRFRAIVVDTRPLVARGGSGAAAILRPRLEASLRAAFADRAGPGGRGTLIVRIRTVSLAAYAGQNGGGRRGFTATDYLEGDVIADGQTFPLLVAQSAGASGAWYLPDNELRRLHALADAFASWTRRRI